MSKNVALFIDVANIYYAARGQDVDVDYIALLKHVTKGRDLIRAYAYSGLDPENENQRKFLDFLSKNGYKVVHKDIRKFNDGRVKANLDIELVVDLFRLQDRMDIAVIVSGDGDFASAMRALQDVGVRCEVISFRPNTSSDLIAVADEFTDIMKISGIGRSKSSRRMSMPEMPAKEVNPEFGFREASRGVAQAALAAIRDTGTGRTSRRRSGRSAGAESTGEAEQATGDETQTAVADHDHDSAAGEGTHRRRRRRGGRGRGRGRRSAEREAGTDAGESADAGEPAWQEFDDVSELTDLGEPGEERSYSFEEADADTLAALGLSSAPAGPTADGDGEAAADKPAPRRRTRSARARKDADETPAETPATAEQATDGGDAPEAPTEPAPRTRRSRSRKAAEPAADAAADASGADADGEPAKPARRTRSRKKATTAEATEGEEPAAKEPAARPSRSRRTKAAAKPGVQGDEASGSSEGSEAATDGDEGIWQRFRSARKTTRRSS